jgi:phage terminase large subunit
MADGSGVIPHFDFDWKNPDYLAVFEERRRRLTWLRERQAAWDRGERDGSNMSPIEALREYYRGDLETRGVRTAQFINDWGVTFDPRNADIGLPTIVPFTLFPKQYDFIQWVFERWSKREPGICDKSRDGGVSWLAMSMASTICLHNEGIVIGFGSRKEEYVDLVGSPKTLFYKGRMFLRYLPEELRGGWDEKKHAPFKRIIIPSTNSTISGEAGDEIGRGDRSALYFVDESASIERPALVDASLSATTNCRIDISSAKGMGNPFAQKRHSWPVHRIFTLHWRDDPRKDQAWYDKQCDELDAVTVAQEIDINYSASATGILIPSSWVQAAIDAHVKLGFAASGDRFGALDVADEGIDMNAFARRHGVVMESVEPWSGKGDDIFGTVEKSFMLADDFGARTWFYDADGLGAGVRGDARVINARRKGDGLHPHNVIAFRGSGEVYRPDAPIPSASQEDGSAKDKRARKNKDFFMNAKAQGWWDLRVRFQRTYRAVKAGELGRYHPDDLISLTGGMPGLVALTMELSQPTYTITTAGKVQIDKAPDGTRSPNHADAAMILYAPRKLGFLSYLD